MSADAMTIEEIAEYVESLGGVVTQRPREGDGTPELAWGDLFFYYSPEGGIPSATQPFATVVTKDYPDDVRSGLDRPGAFRVNVAAGRDAFVRWTGRDPRDPEPDAAAPSPDDAVIAHPVYGSVGWLAVVNPGPSARQDLLELLDAAHALARSRHERRADL